jgi:hypothetical protein
MTGLKPEVRDIVPAYLIAEHIITDAAKFEEYRTPAYGHNSHMRCVPVVP